ncbi:MAG: class I SAM-dependent methyltransferase [Eubacteriales bacterium]|nr:class I SAM-dependent methyltransferase [Eubacteriales bacterium]
MSNQNIYDNQDFFNGYYTLRARDDCYNDLLEQPAISEFAPDLQNKTVLDLGCGYGHNCVDFIRRGAKKVIGIDISQKMLDVARKESCDSKIEYINMSITEIDSLTETFDLVYSSLAFHYIENFKKLIRDINHLLEKGGYLLYSQEHPIITATIDGAGHFNRNEQGERVSYTFSNYNQSGKREIHWYVDGVIKYHRPMGEILTTIAKSGFIIEEVNEPTPKDWAIEKLPSITKEFLKPNFLIIKARKG